MPEITITRADGVQVIRLTRPEKKNALTAAMYTAMADALAEGDAAPDVAAHLFVGTAGVFSAGNDINDFLKTRGPDGGLGAPVVRFIRALPAVQKPMIAAVNGAAVGGGFELVLNCDLVVASESSRFGLPEVKRGLLAAGGGTLLGGGWEGGRGSNINTGGGAL